MFHVRSGLDVLLERRFAPLRGLRVGVLCHQASVDAHLRHLIELLRSNHVHLTAIFAPEHGLWGTAQDQVPIPTVVSDQWSVTQTTDHRLPVHSLYGDHRTPTAKQLQNVDVLVCDLQDVGSRYYTFVWTMALAMQACAKHGKKFMVLDRPNPINGQTLEGPVLDLNFASFVGLYPTPVRHGMTIGEIAIWVNEGLGVGAELEVIRMKGWRRSMYFDQTGLPWVLPSPNMPTLDTATVYPGGCLIEGTNLSEGRGTTRPFELIGAPFIDPDKLAGNLNAFKLPGVTFRACQFEPTFHKFAGKTCGGVQVHVTNRQTFKPFYTFVRLIQEVRALYPSAFAWRDPPYEYERVKLPFDILCGTDGIRKTIETNGSLASLERNWKDDLALFAQQRKPFLLYN